MAWLLALLLALSALFRGFSITSVPPELFGDEIDVGYQAFSLYQTGRDLYNQPFPTYLHSLSEWRMPALMYFTVPTIAAFGTSEVGVRLPQVIFGSLAPLILFLLVYHTTKSRSLSFLSALSLALMPWHIHYSRVAFEVVIMLDAVMLGTLLYLNRRYTLSFILFSIGIYSYSTAILFVPLILLTLFVFTRRRMPSIISLILLPLLLVPLAYHIFVGSASDRFGIVSIFKNADIVKAINEDRSLEPISEGAIWHNKLESYSRLVLANYLRAYSSEFLFVRGDPTHRHSIQVIGQLLPITAPFILLGLYYLAKRRSWLWLMWFALAPVPSIITSDGGYHATRLFLEIPPLAVATGAGIKAVASLKPKLIYPFLLLLFTAYFSWVAHFYLIHYSRASWRWWHVGYKSALTKLHELAPAYSRVFINNSYEPSLIRFLFYTAYSPKAFHRQFTLDQPIPDIAPNYDGFSLDGKYFFGNFQKDPWTETLLPGAMYLVSQRDNVAGDWDWRTTPPKEVRVLHTSTNPYNQPLFYLITRP